MAGVAVCMLAVARSSPAFSPAPASAAQCFVDAGVNYNSHPHNLDVMAAADPERCCGG